MAWWHRFDCDRAVLFDFEFGSLPGAKPEPRCVVARELPSGTTTRVWLDGVTPVVPCPIDVGPSTLVVAYYASAEFSCMECLGWPLPERCLDLFTEFRNETNGLERLPAGSGLLGALTYFGLPALESEEKETMRTLALRGGPYSFDEVTALMDYCESDVVALERLAPVLVACIKYPKLALLRGRYMKAAARIEMQGIPVDVPFLQRLKAHWSEVQREMIECVAAETGVYEGRTFKMQRFEAWAASMRLPWPRLESGRLDLKEETFKQMANVFPVVRPLYEVRVALGKMRLSELPVGPDGRNRTLLSAFRSKTGRNQPSNSRFMLGPSAWLRSAIRPEPGRALAYIDYSQQEVGIAGALSGDETMKAAYSSGDPYLTFAKQAGAVPSDATKASHPGQRELFKACTLAVQYGMAADSLARRINRPVHEAQELLRLHRTTYRRFWDWSVAQVNGALASGRMMTCYGWRLRVGAHPNLRSLSNFPMQAHGAEILRVACILGTEKGIEICAPVHDAVLIEADSDAIEQKVDEMRTIMRQAGEHVLAGFSLGTEKFLKGPVPLPWLTKALCLGGKVPHVALAIRFQQGMRPAEPIALTPTLLRLFGCDNRQSAYRALNALVGAGLVSVVRSKGVCPRVTILEITVVQGEDSHGPQE